MKSIIHKSNNIRKKHSNSGFIALSLMGVIFLTLFCSLANMSLTKNNKTPSLDKELNPATDQLNSMINVDPVHSITTPVSLEFNPDDYRTNYKSASVPSNQSEGYAIICGVSNYPGSDRDLQYCDDDVNDLVYYAKSVLKIPSSHIIKLIDADCTQPNIQNAFNTFNALMDTNDFLFYSFSGHGSATENTQTNAWNIASPHNYPNNYDNYWSYNIPGASAMRVHFSRIETEYNYDYVFIGENAHRNECWDYYTGTYTNIWSYWVLTDDIYVELDADSSYTDWGFAADQVQALFFVEPTEFIPYDGIDDGFWGSEYDTVLDTLHGKSVSLFDSCHSGGVGNAAQGTNRYIATAAEYDEFSLEDSSYKNGLYTYQFLNGWAQSNDFNNDGAVSFEESFGPVYTNTVSRSSSLGSVHHPVQFDGIPGETIFQPNAKILECTNDSQGNLSIFYSHNGLGFGEMVCSLYDIPNQTFIIGYYNNCLIGTNSFSRKNISSPGTDFVLSAYTIQLTAKYNDFCEKSNISQAFSNTFSTSSDSDGDSIIDANEFYLGTNPWSNDTDGDGLLDNFERQYGFTNFGNDALDDIDEDGMNNLQEQFNHTNPISNDTDADMLNDWAEITTYHTNPLLNDTDSDQILDGIETNTFHSSPLLNDTDSDGFCDFYEYTHGLNPNLDDTLFDLDQDGLTNLQEFQLGTNPSSVDSDQDLLSDGWEKTYNFNPLVFNAFEDTDSDGLYNYYEFLYGGNPLVADTDEDGLNDFQEYHLNTNLSNPDSDGDSYSDFIEYQLMNNPNDPSDTPKNHYSFLAVLIACLLALFVFPRVLTKFYTKHQKMPPSDYPSNMQSSYAVHPTYNAVEEDAGMDYSSRDMSSTGTGTSPGTGTNTGTGTSTGTGTNNITRCLKCGGLKYKGKCLLCGDLDFQN